MGCFINPCQQHYCKGVGQSPGSDYSTPVNADVVAPFVKISISNEKTFVTVGNNSTSEQFYNRAVIKSFTYGQSSGIGAMIEIVDEEGGAFHKFFQKVVSDPKTALEKYKIVVQWGWLATACQGLVEEKKSKKHWFNITHVSIKFEQTLTFILECTDMLHLHDEIRQLKWHGGDADGHKMKLKDAIRELFREALPPIETVRFKSRDKSTQGGDDDWDFEGDPEGKWCAMSQTPLVAAQNWVQDYLTKEQKKAVTFGWDDTSEKPTLIIWEDPSPRVDQNTQCQQGSDRHLGTYIVNGGPCSPVISFTPNIKWAFGHAAMTAGAFTPTTAKAMIAVDNTKAKLDGTDDEHYNTSGTTMKVTAGAKETTLSNKGNEKSASDAQEAQQVSAIANRSYSVITAELRIQGNPDLDNPLLLKGAYASLIVVNPYHIDAKGECGDWVPSGQQGGLADSTCNEILSHKTWLVLGVAHEIRLGTFTTTIQLQLAAPGSEINRDQPLGASGNVKKE